MSRSYDLEFALIRTSDNDVTPINECVEILNKCKGKKFIDKNKEYWQQIKLMYCNLIDDDQRKKIKVADPYVLFNKINEIDDEVDNNLCDSCVFCTDIINFEFKLSDNEFSDDISIICKDQRARLLEIYTILLKRKKNTTFLKLKKDLSPETWNNMKSKSVVKINDIITVSKTEEEMLIRLKDLLKVVYNKGLFANKEYINYAEIYTTEEFMENQTQDDTPYKLICQITCEDKQMSYISYPFN